jgi:RNA polymerase sigma-70 factor (ECF subfamily)
MEKDKKILALLKTEDESAMELIFDNYYQYLVITAHNILKDEHYAKDLVQETLFHFWTKRSDLNITSGLKSYLRRAIVNKAIDQIRKKKRSGTEIEITDYNQSSSNHTAQQKMETEDLQAVIFASLESLPKRCKEVFTLSRFEQLSHKEIATKLNISTKTIENQITKALKTVRQAVTKYKELSILLGSYFFS